MPYIKQTYRDIVNPEVPNYGKVIDYQTITNPGELNFAITTIIKHYLEVKGINYTAINDITGALECAKIEHYRRVAIPYETKKINENKDVY